MTTFKSESGFQQIVERQRKRLELAHQIKLAWAAACSHDGIDPSSKFVTFSKDNPFIVEHDRLVNGFFDSLGDIT